jgi:16S rRNA (cytidine1402-2'-O)-methyltransferase
MSQKSYDGEVALYLIPTPIGNMDDITLRAIETLKKVDVLFTEDTRVARELLRKLNISKKTISSHEYNEQENKRKMVMFLQDNKNVGIITDRGTPIISDPGYALVIEAIKYGFNVVSLPGPTALIPALTSSGLQPYPFTFIGFLSNKSAKRKKELNEYKSLTSTLIFYEAPHRIKETLSDIWKIFGDRNISISREISKKFEEIYRGKISEIFDEIKLKGEFVIVVAGAKETNNYDDTIVEQVNSYMKDGLNTMNAIKKVARDRHINKNDVYNEYHGLKK